MLLVPLYARRQNPSTPLLLPLPLPLLRQLRQRLFALALLPLLGKPLPTLSRTLPSRPWTLPRTRPRKSPPLLLKALQTLPRTQ